MPESLMRGCDEGPESRLAEMDSGRKNRRSVYRVRDGQHGAGPAPSRRRVVSGRRSICNRSRRIVLEDADMGIVIGPVLRSADGYRFDTWTAGKGVTRGYPYRRIEDAHYARNAEIKASAQGRAPSAIVCQTLDELIAESTGYEMLAAA